MVSEISKIAIGYEWGRRETGEPVSRPTRIGVECSTEKLDPLQISNIEGCGGTYLILTDDKKAYTFGPNEYGLLGIPEFPLGESSDKPAEVVSIQGLVREISAGRRHFLALTKDGKVYAWGNNSYGQVGKCPFDTGDPSKKSSGTASEPTAKIVSVPSIVKLERPIKQVLAVDNSSYALDESGTVWSWGREQYIGRASGEITEKDRDGQPVILPANYAPMRVKVTDKNGKKLKIRKLLRKGTKVIALLDSDKKPKVDEEEKEESDRFDLDTSKEHQAAKVPETKKVHGMNASPLKEILIDQEQEDQKTLKRMLEECNSKILKPLAIFESTLLFKASECKGLMEKAFSGVVRNSEAKENSMEENLLPKSFHIDLKKGIRELDVISEDFNEMKKRYIRQSKPAAEEGDANVAEVIMNMLEDGIKLRKLSLLALKLHTYHLRLKRKNILSLASGSFSSESPPISELIKEMETVLGECQYIIKRFTDLRGEFNKAYDGKANTLASYTAYHMLDTTYSECQAWKYVNMVGKYAILYQSGYENFLSITEKMGELYEMYNELKKGEVWQIAKAHEAAVEQEQQKDIIEKAREQIEAVTNNIRAARDKICVLGHDGDSTHKKALIQAYEILVALSTLRLAYNDLFDSFYIGVRKIQPPAPKQLKQRQNYFLNSCRYSLYGGLIGD
eukprot:TRINITY_DN135536_c0_g1_i1.p1 TRINITY_DN135536_c0_g1~~TRINITY_DN135536_c0_g1_i1.p1  ORF type:complete len:705 (+),score=84.00 TRINITY_DN135536_c0_g1_i1:85-2115(+)